MHYLTTESLTLSSNRSTARRAANVAKLHGCLAEALWEMESFLSPSTTQQPEGTQAQQKKHQAAKSRLVDLLYHYHGEYQFYVSAQLRTALADLIVEMNAHIDHFQEYMLSTASNPAAPSREDAMRAWTRAWNTIKYQVSVASQALENELRLLTSIEAVPGSVAEERYSHRQDELFAFPAARSASHSRVRTAEDHGSLAA